MALHLGEILIDRYYIQERLDSGYTGVRTYAAIDQRNNTSVVVKELDLRNIEAWKTLDLFEREAKTLAFLQHPRIPRVIEYFRQEDADHLRMYLVMTRMPGQSLAERLAANWCPHEEEVRAIAVDTLKILEFLHLLNPPV